MRIVLLGHNLGDAGGMTGGKNMVRALFKTMPQHQYLLVCSEKGGWDALSLPPGSDRYYVPAKINTLKRLVFERFQLPKLAKAFQPDVIFGLGNFGLLHPPCKQVIWIRDAHYVYDKKHFGDVTVPYRIIKAFHKHRLRQCVPCTDMFFCQTSIMQRRITSEFSLSGSQTQILPNALSEFVKASDDDASPEILKDKEWFSLFLLGRYYSHKNQNMLLDLFRKYRERLQRIRCLITISPEQHRGARKLLGDIQRCGLEDHIVNIGPLTQEELPGYFIHSDALLFPTLLESFSATYLEAMYFGLPILTSDFDFAHYICGDAAKYFDPWRLEDALNAIVSIKEDSLLRDKLIRAGYDRISGFFKPWEDVAAEAIQKIENIVEK